MASSDQSFLDRVFAAKSPDESRKLYDQWASSYDADMQKWSFTAPRIIAQLAQKYIETSPGEACVVDAGCGSGLVGTELAKLGFKAVDGLDLSDGMLKVARNTGAYRNLNIADLTQRLEAKDGAYDALVCSGTFTHGHLGPGPLPEFARIVKVGGILVVTILETFWKEGKFEEVVKKLEDDGKVQVLENELHNYRKFEGSESGGLILVLRRL